MNKSIALICIFFTINVLFFACTNAKQNNDTIEYMSKNDTKMNVSRDCKRIVKEFEGKLVENISGKLVVVGNEPFTKLKLKSKNEKTETIVYQIVKECSDDLWDLQNIELKISGKVKEEYLEMVTGQKMQILTLYPTEIYKKIWGD